MAVTTAFTGNSGTVTVGTAILEVKSFTVNLDTNMVDFSACTRAWQEQKPGSRNWNASVTCLAVAAGTNGAKFTGSAATIQLDTVDGVAFDSIASGGQIKSATLQLDLDGEVVFNFEIVGLSDALSQSTPA